MCVTRHPREGVQQCYTSSCAPPSPELSKGITVSSGVNDFLCPVDLDRNKLLQPLFEACSILIGRDCG